MEHSIPLHDCCTAVLQRYLAQFRLMLRTARASGLKPDSEWMQLRLAADMFPLSKQAEIACNMALRAVYPLVGRPIPTYGEFDPTFDGLEGRLDYVERCLTEALKLPAVEGHRPITADLWGEVFTLPLAQYITQLMLPNFFFHLSMTYALLRHAGLNIGKRDFDGYSPPPFRSPLRWSPGAIRTGAR